MPGKGTHLYKTVVSENHYSAIDRNAPNDYMGSCLTAMYNKDSDILSEAGGGGFGDPYQNSYTARLWSLDRKRYAAVTPLVGRFVPNFQ